MGLLGFPFLEHAPTRFAARRDDQGEVSFPKLIIESIKIQHQTVFNCHWNNSGIVGPAFNKS